MLSVVPLQPVNMLQLLKGSSESGFGSPRDIRVNCFNPTKVRLKADAGLDLRAGGETLQPHKGSSESLTR